MATSILRTDDGWWVADETGAARVATEASTTAALLADPAALDAARSSSERVDPAGLQLRSPVTAPCRVVAQMTNYVSHIREAGMNPATVPLTFFRKTSASICGPTDDIVRPAHVGLLDHEVELGLVIGRSVPVGTELTAEDLPEVVGGLVIANDVSARDVQLPKTQFYEAKSYPTFTPTGPALVRCDADELRRLPDLRLRCWVNGELRQDMTAADMVYQPLDALRALSRFQPLEPGDLVLTGTPGGTALQAPPKPVELVGNLLPPATRWKLFFKRQASNPRWLKPGDVVELAIATDDGAIDLGRQRTVVRAAS